MKEEIKDMINLLLLPTEKIQTIDYLEQCFKTIGRNDFILNDKDIEDLKNGKIINATIEGEYSMTLRYKKGE